MRYDAHFSMLPMRAFRSVGGKLMTLEGGDKGGGDAPDYTPMAQASEKAAQIMSDQADRVLAESQRQYNKNMEVAKPVIDTQLGLMQQTKQQGDEYYNYWKDDFKPVEQKLIDEADAAGSQTAQDDAAARAVADSQGGYTRALNQAFRQSRRYGLSPVTTAGSQVLAQAQSTAAAAGTARDKEKNLGYAKKLEVAGLGRGMPGAANAAYSVANQSGNSAVANQMQPSNQTMGANISAAGLVGQGQQMKLQGLGQILNSQTNMAMNNGGDDGFGTIMGLANLGLNAYKTFSDRRLKENIVQVGTDERTGLHLYEFNYIGEPDYRFRGVMADEVEKVVPEAVVYGDDGFASVNYSMLGIEMVRI